MEIQRVQALEATLDFEPAGNHDEVVAVDGLDDLFKWASEMVADGLDGRARKAKEQRIRRNVLGVIQRNKQHEAQEKFGEEIQYLQRRVIALMQVLHEKMEENSHIKQVMVAQYFALQKVSQLEDEVKQLQALTWYREEAEAERKHLMNALSRLKKERDILDDLLTVNENENVRLANLLNQCRSELSGLKGRRWWHCLVNFFKRS